MTYTCYDCGATKTSNIPAIGHSYGAWTQHNATQHKKTCACGDVKSENHTWNSGMITTQATHITEGVKTFTCTGCGATKTSTISAIGHTYGEWVNHNGTQHEKTCTCGNAVYEDHNWELKKETPATHTKEGVKNYTCAGCGETKTETIAKTTAHTYSDWTKYNALEHKKTCECGDTVSAEHKWGDGVTVVDATKKTEGKREFVCADCGAKKTEVIPKVEGCMSTIAGGAALMLVLTIGSAGLVCKKKED